MKQKSGVNRKKELISILIVSIFILGFFLIEVKATGMVTNEVLDEFENVDELNVIITLKDTKQGFFSVQDIKTKDVLNKFEKKEFEKKHEFKNFKGFSGKINNKGLKKLMNNPDVKRIEINHKMHLFLNDSVDVIGGSNVHILNYTGLGETIAILDTGVNYSLSSLSGKYLDGFDFVNNDSEPFDDNGHGTHVTGIAVGNGIVTGVAFDSNFVSLKVMDSAGDGNEDDIIAGIDWCISKKNLYNISVISLSLGTNEVFSDYCDNSFISLSESVNSAVANGINVIVSSGNLGNKDGISSPACLFNTTSVGWTDDNDNINSQSNSALILDLLAPGEGIVSLNYLGGLKTLSGTSMSAPHVAGAVALLKQFVKEYNGNNLSVSDAINVLKENGVDLTDTNDIIKPRIDVYSAILSFDSTNPILVLDSPLNKSYLSNNISLNYSASDDLSLDKVWYNLNGGVDVYLNENNSLNLSDDNYNLIIYANDSVNNINYTGVDFVMNSFAPVFNSIPILVGNTSELYNYYVNATDGNDLIYNLVSGPDGMNISGQNINWLPNKTQDSVYAVNISVNDGLNIVYQDYVLNISYVNHAPYLSSNISNIAWDENTNSSFNISLNFDDDENNIIGYDNNLISNISVSINNNTGIVTLTPDINFTGNRSVIFSAYDSEFSVDSNNLSLFVSNTADCGNDIIESGEDCEGSNLNNKSCISKGYDSGTLSCSSCSFNISDCSNNEETTGDDSSDNTLETNTADEIIEDDEDVVETSEIVSISSSDSNNELEEEIKEIAEPKKSFVKRIFNIDNIFDFVKFPAIAIKKVFTRLWGLIF